MALRRSHPRCSPRRNLPPLDPMEDELAREPGSVGGPHSGSTSFALSCNPTLGPELVFALNPAPVPASAPPSFDELFKQFMRAYLEPNQRLKQPLAERERSFKAKVPKMYYGKSHMDCYHFCQQCKDYFETIEATRINRTLFVASFLYGSISMHWTQYKHCHRGEKLTSITWAEFKVFLRKNLGESKSFVDSIWKKLEKDFQYQLEEIYNWASHLEHLQFILMEFDPATAPTESTMVRYFEESLKPSIKAEMDQDATHLNDYEELVAKAIRAKAKDSLRLGSYIREADLQVLRGSWPTHTTAYKVQTQGAVTHGDKSKTKAPTSTPAQDSEPSDKSRKDKKKKHYKEKKDFREPREDSTIPASGVNAAEVGGGGKYSKRNKKDPSGVTCYNCNKKRHFADKCQESQKSKN